MLQSKAHLELTNGATGKEFKLNKTEFPVFLEGIMPLEAFEKVIEIK